MTIPFNPFLRKEFAMGWIAAGVLWVLATILFWLEESDGSFARMDFLDWLLAIFWPAIVFWVVVRELRRTISESLGRRRAYKRGYKDGYAKKKWPETIDYRQYYFDGYNCGDKDSSRLSVQSARIH